MLGKKIVSLRKKEGLSQEALAERLNVSRQTIGKWELGDTSPDIIQAKNVSKIFKISLDELLDNDIREILESKISNTEKLARMIMRILKGSGVILILTLIFIFFYFIRSSTYAWFVGDSIIDCTVGDKHYYYEIEVKTSGESDYSGEIRNDNTISDITKIGGNAYLSDILDLTKYEYTYQLFDTIYSYVDKNNGTCN